MPRKHKRVLTCNRCGFETDTLNECYDHPEEVCDACFSECGLCLIAYCKDCVKKCGNVEEDCENFECEEHRGKRLLCAWCTWLAENSQMDYHVWLQDVFFVKILQTKYSI